MKIEMSEIEHAGHYGDGNGHNLIQADVSDSDWAPGRPVPGELAMNAMTYHVGYVDKAGRQHWVFIKQAPLRGTCRNGFCKSVTR